MSRFVNLALPLLVLTVACSKQVDSDATKAADSTAPPPQASVPPAPAPDSVVPWPRLSEILRYETSTILAVRQTHALAVTLRMKDGRTYRSTEPQLDAVVRLVREVDQAGRILIATE